MAQRACLYTRDLSASSYANKERAEPHCKRFRWNLTDFRISPFIRVKAQGKKLKNHDANVDNGFVVYMEEALKNKHERFEDQGKASKLLLICTSKDHSREQIGSFWSGISWANAPYPSNKSHPTVADKGSGYEGAEEKRPTTDDAKLEQFCFNLKCWHDIIDIISLVFDFFLSWIPVWSMILSFDGKFLVKKVQGYLCFLIEDLLDKSIRRIVETYSYMISSFDIFVISFEGIGPFKNYSLNVKLPFNEFLKKFVCDAKFGKSLDFKSKQSYTCFEEFFGFMTKSLWKKGLSNLVLGNLLFVFKSPLGLYVDNILEFSFVFASPSELKSSWNFKKNFDWMRFHYIVIHESLLKDWENESLNSHVRFKEIKSYMMAIHRWVFGFEKDESF
ncbi:hypothetical protein M9H77_07930 [Catharanthus roseus]|uniref:Uncharacterized protein n=1 Tax=Catharanthus roseus TaxID=4058 RepID=A0ACC0BWI6_CATRO|nr:hypothetical protein M9H77_07930 [Catharanthus roseus]